MSRHDPAPSRHADPVRLERLCAAVEPRDRPQRGEQQATVTTWRLALPATTWVVEHQRWGAAEAAVAAVELERGHEHAPEGLLGRLRLTTQAHPDEPDRHVAELGCVWLDTNQPTPRPRLRRAVTLDELEDAAGVRLDGLLADTTAIVFATRAEAFDDTGKNRNRPCAVFDHDDDLAAVLCYAATRLLPLKL